MTEEVPPAPVNYRARDTHSDWNPHEVMTRTGEPMFEADGKTISAAGRAEVLLRRQEATAGFVKGPERIYNAAKPL